MTPDFRLDDLEPADQDTAALHYDIWEEEFEQISQHDVGERSFIVAFDTKATWNPFPHMPNLAAFDIVRDTQQGTFSMRHSTHAGLAFAQNWLVNRDCPPDALAPSSEFAFKPADELTVRVEDRIRRSGERFQVVEEQAIDGADTEGWSIAVDRQDKDLPVRLLFEQVQPDRATYSVREGAFVDLVAADRWLEERSVPLPEPPEYGLDAGALRTRAALARTPAAAVPRPGGSAPSPAAKPVIPQRSPGRSL